MIDDRYFIEPAVWSVDADALKAVRTEVFIVEQQIPEREEWDAEHEGACHPAPAPRFSRSVAAVPAQPRKSGADTEEILAELGCDEAQRKALRDNAVVG